jgi:HSP20 family protein
VRALQARGNKEERFVAAARKTRKKSRTAKKSTTRKKSTGAKKSTSRTKSAATKKSTSKEAAPPPAAAARSAVPVEAAPTERALEARLPGPLEEMERLLEAFRRRDWFRPLGLDWPAWPESPLEGRFPSIDVIDRDKEIQINAEVPGIKKDDLTVTVSDRSLTIRGESRQEEESGEEGQVHRREIRTGSFSRTMPLPEDVDGSKARASYKDGLLELRLPKRRRSKKHAVKVD